MVRLALLSSGALAWSMAFSGCQTGPEGTGREAAPPSSPAATTPRSFAEIGDRRITQVVAPEGLLLSRCRYAVGPEERDLLVDEPMARASSGARADLSAILSLLEGRLSSAQTSAPLEGFARRDGPAGGPGGPLRAYELVAAESWAFELTVWDPPAPGPEGSSVRVLALVNRREIALEASAPQLLDHLRGLSLRALRLSMAKPRRALDWQYGALAGFLDGRAPPDPRLLDREGQSLAGLRKEIIEHLASREVEGPAAEAVLAQARSFEESEVAPHLRSQRLAVRLLALAREGWHGKRPAVAEVLTLSLEYSGQDRLFDRVVRSLFPAALNPLLYRKFPEGPREGASFVREVRSIFERAEHAQGLGWTLEGSKGAP